MQLRSDRVEHLGLAAGNRDMHLLAADIDECGALVKYRQVAHDQPQDRVEPVAVVASSVAFQA